MSEKPSDKPPRPSESLRPGVPRLLASLTVDPMFLVIRLVAALAEGVTKAILEWRDRRKEKKNGRKKTKRGEDENAS